MAVKKQMDINKLMKIEPLKRTGRVVSYDDEGNPVKVYNGITSAANDLNITSSGIQQSLALGCRVGKYRFKRLTEVLLKRNHSNTTCPRLKAHPNEDHFLLETDEGNMVCSCIAPVRSFNG